MKETSYFSNYGIEFHLSLIPFKWDQIDLNTVIIWMNYFLTSNTSWTASLRDIQYTWYRIVYPSDQITTSVIN